MTHDEHGNRRCRFELGLDECCMIGQNDSGRACIPAIGFGFGRPAPTALIDSCTEDPTAGERWKQIIRVVDMVAKTMEMDQARYGGSATRLYMGVNIVPRIRQRRLRTHCPCLLVDGQSVGELELGLGDVDVGHGERYCTEVKGGSN